MQPIDFYGDAKKVFEKDRVREAYNQALEDFEKCLIQQSIYTETEEGWSGMTVDAKTIKNIKEQLKKY